MRRALVAAVVVAAAALFGPLPTAAQAGERIQSFDTTIEVQPDGSLRVTEVIRYDFGPNSRRGILRDIPVRFDYEPDPKYERLNRIDDVSVSTSPGAPSNLSIESEGRYRRFRIGDPDVFIRGAHTYTIHYRVRGALNSFDEHEELYWNATGDQWPVPIDEASVTVRAPGAITQVACYAGPAGSRLTCDEASGAGSPAARFAQRRLSSFEGLTVVVAMAKGSVTVPPPILDERWHPSRA
ncbi:MAG TPA: DUF2207 domain-containing protein, partial [Acidimicrobiales bacterium]|nr:DUF2207 domain-containing protein [Acidimicrobiales bacterium]